MLKERLDVAMTALNRFIYYFPRVIHLILLPYLYVSTLWLLEERWWQILGLIMMFLILFFPFIKKFDLKFYYRISFFIYLAVIILFFPFYLFEGNSSFNIRNFFDYHNNVILCDMIIMLIVDMWFFSQSKLKLFST